ncbi:MAG: M15 family metallopeptidase [Acidobacteria bacterium]|nr:M15 family metallopeptidase [Acidobacteriota bacterium]
MAHERVPAAQEQPPASDASHQPPNLGRPIAPDVLEAPGPAPPPSGVPVFQPEPTPAAMQEEFARKGFTLDAPSGNYLSPRVLAKTRQEDLVPVEIGGAYVKDLRGGTVFLRESIRARLLAADQALFKKAQKHLVITYGFRSNTLQQELFNQLHGKGKVAQAGESFHEAGMAVDLSNWREAQRFMIEAGFVGGCYGIEEDLVHYSIDEITKASNMDVFTRCTLKEIPEDIVKGVKKVGKVVGKAGKVTIGKIKKK